MASFFNSNFCLCIHNKNYFVCFSDFVARFDDSFSDFIFIMNDFPSTYPNTEATVVADVIQLAG